ncbi:hypothetical protein SAMN05892883_1911 [Jatrophihabitans sp. GAS493]|uniref:hypothetical protein n=1 Tax=Jatrophihabitans sp. GAS493 TaxID=1907575 RepID=UPI000BB6E6F1|nr:hypothetical protein [Jatrophihabitans sp. GAS493]SOD72519.1 hypothetical protein SAMN05892883_1911 [Jatrophihabitans sp. GAS493]
MTLRTKLRVTVLSLVVIVLISVVLGVQLANGGGHFAPARPANPCAPRNVTPVSTGIEGLGEHLVLLGLDGAACRLGVTREALTLQLAQSKTPPTDAEVNAVRAGLLEAVDRMKADNTLPPASALVDEALADSNLNPLVKGAIRLLPDSVVNSALKTDDVLKRAINELDMAKLLSNLDDPDDLTKQINAALTVAVRESLLARLRGLI